MSQIVLRTIGLILLLIVVALHSDSLIGEQDDHAEGAILNLSDLKRIEQNGRTSTACWHYQLMQIHDYMINSSWLVSGYELVRDGKKYKNNTKIGPFAEMLKGSRLEVFQTDNACDLVIAFRGTYQDALIVDLLQDLNFLPSKSNPDYHPGFLDAANSYRPILKKVVGEAQKKCGSKDIAITVTGHSLGGAIAYSVVNILKDLELGKPELVLFGSPRVVRHPSRQQDIVKAVHYYIDRDPVVLSPPAIMFRELTDDLYRFNKVPVIEEVSVTGHQLFQNHLPSNYIKKMALWCEGKEIPKRVARFTHTLSQTGFDATQRVVRSAVDAAGNAVLPNKNESGGTLPPVSEGILTYMNSSDNSKGNPKLWNSGDGKAFASDLACGVSHLWGTKTKAGRQYYCIKTLKINETAKKACSKACETKTLRAGGCLEGCYDHLHQFCIGNWSCQGEPLRG